MGTDTLAGIRDVNDTGAASDAVRTTMDGTRDGAAAPTIIEPGHDVAPVVTPAPAPISPTAPTTEEAERALKQKIKDRSFKDPGRAAIYERRNAMTIEERQELESMDAESAAILDAQAGHVSQNPLAPAPVANDGIPEFPAGPAAPAAPAPVASNGKTYKLSIYGQEQIATEDDVIRAGVAALQKQHGADARMQDAATYEAQLNAYADQLQGVANQIAARTAASPQPGTAGNPAPTTGGAAAVDRAALKKALDAVGNLDTDAAVDAMAKVIADAVAGGRAPTPTPAPTLAIGDVPRLQQAPADPWGESQRTAANKVFNEEYAHFNDAQFAAAQAAVTEAMADPANRGVQLESIVRNVCRTTQRFMPATTTPAPAPTNPTAEELDGRRQLKARLPVTPPAAVGRAPGATQEPRYPTPAEYVRHRQRLSGSNSTR